MFFQDSSLKEDDNVDFKKEHKFAEHMQDKTEASSDFAMKKTLMQQRHYLPIFAVRETVRLNWAINIHADTC